MASFFYFIGVAHQEDDIIDTLAARYKWSVADILDMSIPRLWMMYNKASTEQLRDRIRMQWVVLLPYMSMEMLQFMSFEDYYDAATGRNLDLRPTAAILAEVEEIRKEMRESNGTVSSGR